MFKKSIAVISKLIFIFLIESKHAVNIISELDPHFKYSLKMAFKVAIKQYFRSHLSFR